ncbi:MAG: di-heme oxidoredictase family protein [Planctomycetota bacterium]
MSLPTRSRLLAGTILIATVVPSLASWSESPRDAAGVTRALHQDPERVPLGGPATVRDVTPDAFSYPAKVLDRKQRRAFVVGNALFKDNWVAAPGSAEGRDGLGPLFNARSCSACHFKDGRGCPPEAGEWTGNGVAVTGFLLRLGVQADGPDAPHPVYGGQLQDRSTNPGEAEARFRVVVDEIEGQYEDGEPYSLLFPGYEFDEASHGDLQDDGVLLGPRVAPQVIGLGLLQAIPVESLEALADPEDEDGDGISGRIHWVRVNGEGGEELRVPGRFGWKATQPTVRHQSAGALNGDMGLTTSLHPAENHTAAQLPDLDYHSGGAPEVDDKKLDRIAFYSETLAVPAQRNPEDPLVLRGEVLFEEIGCAQCHTPIQRTGDEACVEAFENVAFRPYTDMLLHDMGPELADEKTDGDASPVEWRTPPLWGIGLFETVNGHSRYLHDGRARDLAEAVLWHGGEGEASKERFRALSKSQRADLLEFLRSL